MRDDVRGSHRRHHACLPKVARPAGEYWVPLEQEQEPRLGEWTPLYLHATREVASSENEEFRSRLTAPESWYFLQIRFTNQGEFSTAGRVSNLDELRQFPRVAELLDEHEGE